MNTHFLTLCCLVASALGCTSCAPRQGASLSSHYSTAKAYYAQAPALPERDPYPKDAPDVDERLVHLEPPAEDQWERRAYESVDEWWLRVRKLLYSHHEEIRKGEFLLSGLETQQHELITQIKEILQRNKEIRSKMEDLESQREEKTEGPRYHLPSAPFAVHLVRKGDTLYSISQRYFGNGDRINDILFWNQGWIRHPEELLAGIGLVLFDKRPDDADVQLVDRYLAEIRTVAQKP